MDILDKFHYNILFIGEIEHYNYTLKVNEEGKKTL